MLPITDPLSPMFFLGKNSQVNKSVVIKQTLQPVPCCHGSVVVNVNTSGDCPNPDPDPTPEPDINNIVDVVGFNTAVEEIVVGKYLRFTYQESLQTLAIFEDSLSGNVPIGSTVGIKCLNPFGILVDSASPLVTLHLSKYKENFIPEGGYAFLKKIAENVWDLNGVTGKGIVVASPPEIIYVPNFVGNLLRVVQGASSESSVDILLPVSSHNLIPIGGEINIKFVDVNGIFEPDSTIVFNKLPSKPTLSFAVGEVFKAVKVDAYQWDCL